VDENVVGFHLDVVNGSQPDDGRCNINTNHGIKTRIILACNSSVKWSSNDLTGLIQVAYLEDLEPCEVNTVKDLASYPGHPMFFNVAWPGYEAKRTSN
jgi:hypothetical protein